MNRRRRIAVWGVGSGITDRLSKTDMVKTSRQTASVAAGIKPFSMSVKSVKSEKRLGFKGFPID